MIGLNYASQPRWQQSVAALLHISLEIASIDSGPDFKLVPW